EKGIPMRRIDLVTESRLMAACEREFERYVDGLFKRNRMYSMYATSTMPIIGGGRYDVAGECSAQKRLLVDALCCQQLFFIYAPDWAPKLPLDPEAARMMARNPDPRLRMVGLFSQHLSARGWPTYEVYGFAKFVRGAGRPQQPGRVPQQFATPERIS